MSLSSASPPWMTSLSCSPSQPASTLLQWLSFVFLSPCPQRMLFSIVDDLFLLVLFGLAIQKLIVRFRQRSGTPEEEKSLLIKAQQWQQQPILTTIRFKIDRRSRSHTRLFSYSSSSSQSSKAPLVLGFISYLAWLYVAGRLWQDAGNRMLLSSLLRENSGNRPRVLTVEDKLMNLGCKEIGRSIVEAEMELTFAKSLGFLRQNRSSSDQKFLAVNPNCFRLKKLISMPINYKN